MSSSSSYKQFAHLQIPLAEIVSATNNFSNANVIRQDGFGREYIGQLSRSGQTINIVARRLDDKNGHGNKEFWMEVSMLSTLQHKNLVSIVGFCDENGEKIVINKHEANGCLDEYLSSNLTWTRRLQICVGVARALSYIYYDVGRDFSVIHRDIKTSKILLSYTWEPKLSGFELSINRAAAERNGPCLADACGTLGYCDPAYVNTGSVTHKSDMFSLGVVLFQVLCGTSAIMVDDENRYFFVLAKSHYEGRRLYQMVDPDLREQMDPQSFNIVSETAYSCLNEQRSERPNIDQIVIELEKALECQRKHKDRLILKVVQGPTSKSSKLADRRIPLEEIVCATNNFSDANLIQVDGYGKEYKGQLSQSGQLIDIVARRVNNGDVQRKFFLMEVSLLSTLKHKNLIAMVGLCDENGEKIVIYKHETRGSLDKFLSDPTLTWMQRLQICVGVARALSYIYYDERRDFSVIHRDIKSSKILLNDNWEAKLSGFELSMNQTAANRNQLCLADVCGTTGYCDPTYFKSGSVTHKSDMYSFGVVLFEVLCGRKVATTDKGDRSLAPSARSHYEGGTLGDMIDPGLRKQMEQQSFEMFSEAAYFCLKEQRLQRPNIDQIVINLEQAWESQRNYEKPAHSIVDNTVSKTLKGKHLEYLKIPLSDIEIATNNFAKEYLIGSGTYGDVYKGELHHFDREKYILS